MERKDLIKNTITDFVKSTKSERLNQLTFGVEFEFQAPDTSDCDCLENLDYEDEYNTDAIYEAEVDEIDNIMSDFDYITDHINFSHLKDEVLDELFITITGRMPTDLNSFIRKESHWELGGKRRILRQRYVERLQRHLFEITCTNTDAGHNSDDIETYLGPLVDLEAVRETVEEYVWDNFDSSEYRHDESYLREQYCECSGVSVCEPNGCELTDDQSVSGGELRTEGAFSYDEIERTSREMIEAIRDGGGRVDTDCSAHLHVKLGDINHYYGKGNLHRCLMEYIALNTHLLPTSVIQRLHRGGNRHIKPNFKHEKFSWVYFHGQGTIEFRLFGNIDDHDDFMRCVQFAADALAYAYRVRALRSKRTDRAKLMQIIELNRVYTERNFGPALKCIQAMTNKELQERCRAVAA